MPKRTATNVDSIRGRFDEELINQYVLHIQREYRLPEDKLWSNVAETLFLSGATFWRRLNKAGRDGKAVRGKTEPRLIDLLRYVAATERSIGLPPGRHVVLASLAVTLDHLRNAREKAQSSKIEPRQVELLRYSQQHPALLEFPNGVGEKMIERMRRDVGWAFRNPQAPTVELVAEVREIVREWRESWAVLLESLPYRWIYYRATDA